MKAIFLSAAPKWPKFDWNFPIFCTMYHRKSIAIKLFFSCNKKLLNMRLDIKIEGHPLQNRRPSDAKIEGHPSQNRRPSDTKIEGHLWPNEGHRWPWGQNEGHLGSAEGPNGLRFDKKKPCLMQHRFRSSERNSHNLHSLRSALRVEP